MLAMCTCAAARACALPTDHCLLCSISRCVCVPCSEAYKWVKDRRPQMAITKDDAQRLQEAELQVGMLARTVGGGCRRQL